MRRSIAIAAVGLALGAIGCSGGNGSVTNAGPNEPYDGLDSAPGPSDAQAEESCSQAEDPLDDQGFDSNCDGADGVVGKDIYADSSRGEDTNPGTPTAPVRTLERAFMRAAITGGSLVLAQGKFPASQLAQGSWRIWGGYDATFQGPPRSDRTVLQVPSSKGLSILEAKRVGLSHLTVQAPHAETSAGQSAYALRFSGEALELDDVRLEAGNALDGKAGEPGDEGSPGRSDCQPLVCKGTLQLEYSYGAQQARNNAQGGLAGSISEGRQAASGEAGADGSPGSSAAAVPRLEQGFLLFPQGTAGQSNGSPGYGGAGGSLGNNQCYKVRGVSSWVHIGGGCGGSGGCPGQGGTGAQSGGVSVALLVLQGAAKISRSELHTGFAGQGGAGGQGGPGGAGGGQGIPYATGYTNDSCRGRSV